MNKITKEMILKEITADYFSDTTNEISIFLDKIMADVSFDEKIKTAKDCMDKLWYKYYPDSTVNILGGFPQIQRALFSLEEDSSTGARYRDHYIHMYNTYVTGARIISKMCLIMDEDEIKKVFCIDDEMDDIPFPEPYDAKERLFFLWVLISTFHDIGIPIEHLDKIRDGLNKFLQFFGLYLKAFLIDEKSGYSEQAISYFEIMSSFNNFKIIPSSNGGYIKSTAPINYLYHCLLKEYGNNNHGVISAICLYNSFVDNFLMYHHKKEKYDLTREQFDLFTQTVLREDVARAGLAIALHSINAEKYPKIFPIRSVDMPLTFLLILCDELQESFRHEGVNYLGITKLNSFPEIDIKKNGEKYDITINMAYGDLSTIEEKDAVSQYNAFIKSHGGETIVVSERSKETGFSKLVEKIRENIFKTLRDKLERSQVFNVYVTISYQNATVTNAKTLPTCDES